MLHCSKLILLVLPILSISSAFSQIFTLNAETDNVFNGVDVGDLANPTFVDIDDDGDFDAFVGATNGTLQFYKNAGTALKPQFLHETDLNPLGTVDVGVFSFPVFVDIDSDGDKDCFVGSEDQGVFFFLNTGSSSVPNFVLTSSLLSGINFELFSKPTFVDIDKDGDFDLFVGDVFGATNYYQNIGSATNPIFQNSPTNPNPLASAVSVQFAAPTFFDLDRDGDFDFILGGSGSFLRYYQNTGSATAPNFVIRTGVESPFAGIAGVASPSAAFADVDEDGDPDLVICGRDGQIRSYRNNTVILPLKLIAFTAVFGTDVTITWKTAEETNTSFFNLQKSYDGTSFSDLKTISAVGRGANTYYVRDNVSGPEQYYRLKIFDADGSSTLSSIVHTSSVVRIPSVKLYPNPAGRLLQIDFTDDFKVPLEVEVMDLAGAVRLKVKLVSKHSQIPVQHLSTGNYLLRLHDGPSIPFMKK